MKLDQPKTVRLSTEEMQALKILVFMEDRNGCDIMRRALIEYAEQRGVKIKKDVQDTNEQ